MDHVYMGTRDQDRVEVLVDGEPLKHIVRSSPTGFDWGYWGSGPADLALSILTHEFGFEPHPTIAGQFKASFVGAFGRVWVLDTKQIREWVVGIKHRL